MTDTPAPAHPASLAERARAAARTHTASDDPHWPDLPWLRHARWIARRLAQTLGIPAEYVALQPSALRRGGWPWPELTITDHDARYRFVAVHGDPAQITAREPGPVCDAEGPPVPNRPRADPGNLIDGTTTDHDADLSSAFDQDPGHQPGCPHAAPAA